jgi:hypothetical protein
MKIKDGLYRYPGLGGTMARAHLRVYDHEGSVVAIVGELTDNPSTSITGSAERVCYLLRAEYGPGVIVIQYYPGGKVTWSTVISPPGTKPAWGPLTQAEAEMVAGEPLKTWAEADYTIANLTGKGLV